MGAVYGAMAKIHAKNIQVDLKNLVQSSEATTNRAT
jgi:hypothetical protein